MCGICGFIRNKNASIRSDINVLKDMCDMLAHRGPDGEGMFIDEHIAFGHRRLSLIDIPGGAQPMVVNIGEIDSLPTDNDLAIDDSRTIDRPACYDEKSGDLIAVTFNGEIYNYKQLSLELAKEGWRFKTQSDTEVLLAGYVIWGGLRILKKVRGMFAFAIWDSRSKSLFCARDPFGIKPFYYTSRPSGNFAFASEAKALLRIPEFEKRLNKFALQHYLCFQFNPLNETFFEGIFKLPPAHYIVITPGSDIKMERYWEPKFKENPNFRKVEAGNRVDAAIRKSVKRHNVADVEVGAYLSGGIDSSYIASVLSKENPMLKTFTVGFKEFDSEDASSNEICAAEYLAEKIGSKQQSEYVTKVDFFNAMKDVQYFMDEPTADPAAVPLFYLNKMASTNVKAVISGEGADEIFAGYQLYGAPLTARRISFLPKKVLRFLSKCFCKFNLRGANYLRRASGKVSDWYYTNANKKAFSVAELRKLLRSSLNNVSPMRVVASSYQEAMKENLDEVKSMQLVDIEHWLVGDILAKSDKMSMANSIECRVPYLDIDVFEVAAQLPTRLNISSKNTKMVLRDASRNALPQRCSDKQKLGFPVPLCKWLREERILQLISNYFKCDVANKFFNTKELFKLLEDHASGKDMSRKIWIIWTFLIWHQLYFPEEWTSITIDDTI